MVYGNLQDTVFNNVSIGQYEELFSLYYSYIELTQGYTVVLRYLSPHVSIDQYEELFLVHYNCIELTQDTVVLGYISPHVSIGQ